MDPAFYDADYFLRGKETGKSLYTDYRWLPDLTIPMAKAIALRMEMHRGDSVLDFGCARGYLVKALCGIGYRAHGYDPSQWVIDHCDPEVADKVSTKLDGQYDWVIAKDVLEHVAPTALRSVVDDLEWRTRRGIFVAVPLSPRHGEPYVVPEYEQDVTHQIRMPLSDWHNLFESVCKQRWIITSTYRIPGVKDNYYDPYPEGNGFITALRLPR